MHETLEMVLSSRSSGWIVLGGLGLAFFLIGSIFSTVKTQMRERSRREIAAYIAEGTMTPEQGERLMAAGEPKKNSCG